jgi:hypothetical protein
MSRHVALLEAVSDSQYATCSTNDYCFQLIWSSTGKEINRNEPALDVSADRRAPQDGDKSGSKHQNR